MPRTSELGIDVEMLLVEDLKNRVKQSTERCVARLLDNCVISVSALPSAVLSISHTFGARLLCIVLRDHGTQFVDVHGILGAFLVRRALDELTVDN